MTKKLLALILALTLLAGLTLSARAEIELSYEGVVVAGETIPVTAAFGGRVAGLKLRKGDLVTKGDVIAEIATTLNYAPLEGTVTGIYAAEGDDADAIATRYGAVMYIEPTNRYTIKATTEKAYNRSENKYIHLGEKVYLSCTADGTHQGTGMVAGLTDEGYTVEVTGGEFYMGETVGIYRQANYAAESRIGRGTVGRTEPVAVKGTGSVLKLHVENGDFVERGELLFETVDGLLDGLYAPDGRVIAPVTGVVASVDTASGESVTKGASVVKVYPTESMQIELAIPEADLFELREGGRVDIEFTWDNDESMNYKGVISSISHLSEESAAGSDKTIYKAYVTFEPDERVRLGMSVIVYPMSDGHGDEGPAASEAAGDEED
ncbi:MAG: HlyD family efflux transporter periplasmic adaptor subunit [Clostridia bacterium]|nr:HlyD family efflux transporter periplasmic adaptor subunit [Clostridia bacterium]